MNTTELVVEIRLEKNSGPYGVWTHDLCNTGRLISSTGSVVFITARITPIFISSTAVHLLWFSYIYNQYFNLNSFSKHAKARVIEFTESKNKKMKGEKSQQKEENSK